jgi:hypothetical protein
MRQSRAQVRPQIAQVRFLHECPCRPAVHRRRVALARSSVGRPICHPRLLCRSFVRRPALRARVVVYRGCVTPRLPHTAIRSDRIGAGASRLDAV